MDQTAAPITNATSYFPSAVDLLLVVPRLLSKAGSLAEQLDLGRMLSGGSIIAAPTASNITNATVSMTGSTFVQESLAAAASAVASTSAAQEDQGIMSSLKTVSVLFGYVTSKWAIATFTTAILLNRTHFYASSRVPLSFNKIYLRLALYILPTLVFVFRIQTLLQALRCQTSPSWSQTQYGAPRRGLLTDFAGEGGFLWQASSTLLFWETEGASCQAVNMLPLSGDRTRPAGSLALLWPLFLSLTFSQFVETLSCALQGRRPLPEVGLTIFEHSLAFAEAEAIVTKPLTLDSTRFWKPESIFTPDGSSISVSRGAMSSFANVPPEVLLISLISSLSHLTSNILAIIGIRAKFRLITTTLGGLAYMAAFIWSFVRFALADPERGIQLGIIRVPTVCIIGFIPHLLILMGIMACGAIYSLAFALTVLSPPPDQHAATWKERISVAYENLHANIHLSTITPLNISWHEDFYTVILKIGFTILTAASEAVFLNESTRVNVSSMTWLDKQRLQEYLARRRRFRQRLTAVPYELQAGIQSNEVDIGVTSEPNVSNSSSGYARERKTRDANPHIPRNTGQTGVGLQQRRGRWQLAYRFLTGISTLLTVISARIIVSILKKLRISYSPGWLRRFAGPQSPPVGKNDDAQSSDRSRFTLRPRGPDIERITREALLQNPEYAHQDRKAFEDDVDQQLYQTFLSSDVPWDVDTTSDYTPPIDDDMTSVISVDDINAGDEDEWSDISDGQRTPTQADMSDNTFDLSRLSLLIDFLNPKTQEDQQEARVLARHLQSPTIMTRSQYRKAIAKDQEKLLSSLRMPIMKVAPEEEEAVLEEFLLHRRNANGNDSGTGNGGSWNSGAEGMGSEGPQCVVCQLSPRTVLVWPCGCLSLCDDCRVGLASKNYATCVCCRTNVVSYSKLFVP
ncbi:ubiquitin-protein ligase-like protein [Dendryphion nanum]|uniref:Ubiquitin-protein ligase-like protein n=1 Tax=Dendryphion nanum TaxID=256645 RepID=A0A9P9DBJ9_9PLEO|nr:ubiquitin-protein ligase-like protein [Dendryphion nanum]